MAAVAVELNHLASQVVFIGGAIAPLLQTHPPFPRARPTSDVDAVVATTTYREAHHLQEALLEKGFRQSPGDTKHIHRWISPSGILFDLVPAGEHFGGSGNEWDMIGIQTAVQTKLANGITIRHVSAPAFLAQKWKAHHDRGVQDPLGSSDLEDILALVASRPTMINEVRNAPEKLKTFLANQAEEFLGGRFAEDLLAAHLNNSQDPAATIDAVRNILRELATLRKN